MIGAHITKGADMTDVILVLQVMTTNYNGYSVIIDKDAKFTFTRENGKDKSAISNKPTQDLYNIFNDDGTFYLVTRQSYEGQDFVDYFASRCSLLEGTNIGCRNGDSIFRDSRKSETPMDVHFNFVAGARMTGVTSVYISNGMDLNIGTINNEGYQIALPRMDITDAKLGMPIMSAWADDLIYIVGKTTTAVENVTTYTLGVFSTVTGSSIITPMTEADKWDLNSYNTVFTTWPQMSSAKTVTIQVGTSIYYQLINRPTISIEPKDSEMINLTLRATDNMGKTFDSPAIKSTFNTLYTEPKLDLVTVGVKFYPGYSSTIPIAQGDIVGQGMNYKVEWGKIESELSELPNDDEKPKMDVIFNGKYDEVTWNKMDGSKITNVYGVGDGQYLATYDDPTNNMVVFTCMDPNPDGRTTIQCAMVLAVPGKKIDNLERAMKAPGKNSYLVLFNNMTQENETTYYTMAF